MDEENGVASDPCEAIGSTNAKHMGNTETLYMCSKNIGWLEGFEKFPNLKYLWLSRNKLRRLDGLESNFRIHCLYASHNRLAALDATCLSRLLHVEELILNDNKLEDLRTHIDMLSKLTRLRRLDLYNNPLAEETSYRLHVVKAMPRLEILDRQKITPEERLKARKVRRASFDMGGAEGGADAVSAPPDAAQTSLGATAAPKAGGGVAADQTSVPAALGAPEDDHGEAFTFEEVMFPIKRRILEKRILLRPHWAESDRRRLGYVSAALFKSVLVRYSLWPAQPNAGDALVRRYRWAERKRRDSRKLERPGATPAPTPPPSAGDARSVDYLRFCRDVEPSGHTGRDLLIREQVLSESWREPIADVSVCAKLAEKEARAIRKRNHRREEEERARMVASNREGMRSSTAPGKGAASAASAGKPPVRRSLDVFQQFVAPDIAASRKLDATLPVLNTQSKYDRNAPALSLSRRGMPPPVPCLRTFTL